VWRCFLKQHLRSHPCSRRFLAGLILLFASCQLAYGQQSGHYLQGVSGLDNGSTAPPGVYVTYLPYVYNVNTLEGPNGNTLLKPDITIVANNVAYQVTTEKRILGGSYGLSAIIPIVNTRFTADIFDTSQQSAGVSDIFVMPVVLGWAKGNATYTLNYGFYAPSGNFDPSLALNPGLGFWEQQIQAGAGYSFDKLKLWNASALTTWEINQSKIGLDVKPGPMFNLEYSLGRRLYKYKINLGAAGYVYEKLSPDSGSGISPLVAGNIDRSYGIGPEFKYTDPIKHLGLDFRYERQFGVEAKTQGDVFVIGITWLNIFPPPASAHH
jgi:hypothetical protein